MRRWLIASAMLGVVGAVSAQIPSLPVIPDALPTESARMLENKRVLLEKQRASVLEAGSNHNIHCRAVKEGSAEHAKCVASRAQLEVAIKMLWATTEALEGDIDTAVAIEKKHLLGRDVELSAAINRDILAIQHLGLNRLAEDFAEWENLATEAKASFEKEIIDSATEVVSAKVRSSVLDGFRAFDDAQAARWIGRLSKVEPRPVELIGMIERLAKVKDKAEIAQSAELILDQIEKLQKTGELLLPSSTTQAREDLMLMGLDLMCDVVPPPGDAPCAAFKTVGKLTVASLYNSAARWVAIREVERLTNMTEAQLLGLAKINELLVRHVRERKEVRAKLKALP